MLENANIPKDPSNLMREQVILLRDVKQALFDLQQSQTKANEELELLATSLQTRSDRSRVKISNVDIPLGSMIVFMLKWIVASIPVLLIVAAIGAALGGVVWYILSYLGYF